MLNGTDFQKKYHLIQMKISDKDSETLDDYLLGSLPVEEESDFRKRLEEEPALKEEFEFRVALQYAVFERSVEENEPATLHIDKPEPASLEELPVKQLTQDKELQEDLNLRVGLAYALDNEEDDKTQNKRVRLRPSENARFRLPRRFRLIPVGSLNIAASLLIVLVVVVVVMNQIPDQNKRTAMNYERVGYVTGADQGGEALNSLQAFNLAQKFMKADDFQEALNYYEQAVKKPSDSEGETVLSLRDRAFCYYDAAIASLYLGKPNDAKTWLKRYVEEAPQGHPMEKKAESLIAQLKENDRARR